MKRDLCKAFVMGIAMWWMMTCMGAGCACWHHLSVDARADALAIFKVVKGR